MQVPKAPCKGCEERQMGCHSSCSKYLDYKRENDERNEAIRNERRQRNAPYAFKREQIEKALRRKGR